MANVYTTRFLEEGPGVTGTFFADVPAGFVWDVRSIEVDCYGASLTGPVPDSVTVSHGAGAIIFRVGPPFASQGNHYSWNGRCLLNPGDQLLLELGGAEYSVVITGYQLTLP